MYHSNPKGNSKLALTNYRPISVLPVISKLLEQLMYERLLNFLNKNKILYDHQFGFQKKKSASMAILDIYSKLIDSIEQKKFSSSVFLDFAKAFDAVNHDILLQKLEYYGIRGVALGLFKNYLQNRPQIVKVGGEISNQLIIKCGVPQGSVLGPLLFLIYINDIYKSSDILQFHLFADDTSIFYSHKNLKNVEMTLNNELIKVSKWLIANKLTLNVSKSNFVIFHPPQKKIHTNITLYISDEKLEEKQFTKYLGVLIDKHLTWKQHIHYVNLKISRGIGLSAKLRHFVPKNTLRTLYYAFIQPNVDYGLLNWGCANKTALNPIRLSIKKAVRIMAFEEKYDKVNKKYVSTRPLFHKFNILNFDNHCKLTIGKFMWEISQNLHPTFIQCLFMKVSEKHQIMTRSSSLNKYSLPHARTNFRKHFINFTGVKLWNDEIPDKIKSQLKLRAFIKQYRCYLLNE